MSTLNANPVYGRSGAADNVRANVKPARIVASAHNRANHGKHRGDPRMWAKPSLRRAVEAADKGAAQRKIEDALEFVSAIVAMVNAPRTPRGETRFAKFNTDCLIVRAEKEHL